MRIPLTKNSNLGGLIAAFSSVLVSLAIFASLATLASAQTPSVIYDLPAIGGNVFPGVDGRLTADDAQLGGTDRVADTLTIPVAALGNGTADVTAFIYEDSGAGPGALLWQATTLGAAFSAPAGSGDFRDLSWTMINTPVPNNIYWGIRFNNVSSGISTLGPREGNLAAISPAGANSDAQTLYVQPVGFESGEFQQFDFFLENSGTDIQDNLAVRLTGYSLATVPEPRVLGLFMAGGLALLLFRRRSRE